MFHGSVLPVFDSAKLRCSKTKPLNGAIVWGQVRRKNTTNLISPGMEFMPRKCCIRSWGPGAPK